MKKIFLIAGLFILVIVILFFLGGRTRIFVYDEITKEPLQCRVTLYPDVPQAQEEIKKGGFAYDISLVMVVRAHIEAQGYASADRVIILTGLFDNDIYLEKKNASGG